jgi:hypothetical protein
MAAGAAVLYVSVCTVRVIRPVAGCAKRVPAICLTLAFRYLFDGPSDVRLRLLLLSLVALSTYQLLAF